MRKNGWKIFYCGYGAGYHECKATRGSDTIEHRRQNQKNGEIFYKGWGMWEEYKKIVGKNVAVENYYTNVGEKME